MLTNMLYGALGALAILSLRLLVQPARRLAQGARRLYRRAIGMEHFEALVIDEMRTYRRDVDFYTRDLPSRLQLSTLDRDVKGTAARLQQHLDAMSAERTRTNRLRREVEELGMLLHQYTEALGPMWQTAMGHRMPMRLLSTGHLKNILDGGFGGYEARDFAKSELERRSIDTAWRVKAQNNEKAPTKADFANRRAQIDPRIPMTYTPEVASRVARVLPQWAQDIIAGLLQPQDLPIKRAERTRIKTLPLWAQQVISDLEQPRG